MKSRRGQTLVETALVLPLFVLVVFGLVVIGIGLFYQQQLTNAAREAARYAVVHSASADDPVCGWLPPDPGAIPDGAGACADTPAAGWPSMHAHARRFAFGLDPNAVNLTACWSGYVDAGLGTPDQGPLWANDGVTPNPWEDCTMGGVNPLTATGSLPCSASTAPGDDKASNLAVSDNDLAVAANRVVVYACYAWSPPLAGFLGIPNVINLRAVVAEGLQHQR